MLLYKKILQMKTNSIANIYKQLNEGLYVKAFLEDGYLYHTTSFRRLQKILKDGFLSSDPNHTKQHHLHEGMICFTTNPMRHLCNFPSFTWMLGVVDYDTYIKFPYAYLESYGVKPVFYTVNLRDLKDLSEQAPYLLQHLTTEEKLREEYGVLFDDYRYNTWIAENEWRVKAEKLPIPETAEIYVSSYYQKKKVITITNLPVFMWKDVVRLKEDIRRKRKKDPSDWETDPCFHETLGTSWRSIIESMTDKEIEEFLEHPVDGDSFLGEY